MQGNQGNPTKFIQRDCIAENSGATSDQLVTKGHSGRCQVVQDNDEMLCEEATRIY